jgi:hypothetical protein
MHLTLVLFSLLLTLALLPTQGLAAAASRAHMQQCADASLNRPGQKVQPAARRPVKG